MWSIFAACSIAAAAMLVSKRMGTRLIGLTIAITCGAALASSLTARNVLVARYFIFVQAMFLCGVAVWIAAIPSRLFRNSVAGAAVLAATCVCIKHAERRQDFTERPGMLAAMAYLADVQQPDDLVVVSNPGLQVTAAAHAIQSNPIRVLCEDPESFPFYQGQAVLRDDEYLSPEKLLPSHGRLWLVDRPWAKTNVPDPWVDVYEEVFPEWFSENSRIVVRCYQVRPGFHDSKSNSTL
jgi:hypothetical protein